MKNMEPEATEALDLSLPKVHPNLSPDDVSSAERSSAHPQVAKSQTGDTTSVYCKSEHIFLERKLHSPSESENISENKIKTEALDLYSTKVQPTLPPEEASSAKCSPGHCQPANSDTDGSSSVHCKPRPTFYQQVPRAHFYSQALNEHGSEDYYMKNENYIPPPKKNKLSLTSYNSSSPPAAYITRNEDASDACLGDDANSSSSIPILDVKIQNEDEIKRTCQGVSVSLHDENLWRAFAKCGTEMIINRGGRRMFPHIILSIEGLHPHTLYSVTLEIVPADQRRYKFIHNQWMPMGTSDPGPEIQPVSHPDSPNTGSFWMQNRASFSKVRLTNNKDSSIKECSEGNILLLSMHKYKVVIKIKEESSRAKAELMFDFDESAFVAVTAYQNSKITQLKIQNNPFAKAFRDCHNPPLVHKAVASRRRDLMSKQCFVTQTEQPAVPVPMIDSQTCFQYPQFPFQQSGFGNIFTNPIEMKTWNPAQYYPWAALGQHWPLPFLTPDSQGLINSLYSKTLSPMTPDACRYLQGDRSRYLSFSDSQTSSGNDTDTDEQEERKGVSLR